MNDARTYPHGVPCWVDTDQPDPLAGRHFYSELFGWTFQDAAPAGSPSYWIASLDGSDAAAIAPGSGDSAAWNTYVAVDDADAAAALVEESGGAVVSAPQAAGPAGRAAVCADPAGAQFRLWQAGRRPGPQIVNGVGAWNFSDVHTDDPDGAQEFYATVFGWEAHPLDLGGGATATMWRRPGYGDHLEATVDPDIRVRQAGLGPPGFEDAIGWLASLEAEASAPHWHVTFTVADRDQSVATVERLGASVLASADTDWTRSAVIRDPQGAVLTLSQFTPPTG
ncbi:MAG TPA: VOC family protein [Solirubrobacteraceae bacterium]|jgi:hypothetical protein